MRWSAYISPADQAEHAGLLRDGELGVIESAIVPGPPVVPLR